MNLVSSVWCLVSSVWCLVAGAWFCRRSAVCGLLLAVGGRWSAVGSPGRGARGEREEEKKRTK
jgi:hypothetical protein